MTAEHVSDSFYEQEEDVPPHPLAWADDINPQKRAVTTALCIAIGGSATDASSLLRYLALHPSIDGMAVVKDTANWWVEKSGREILNPPKGFKTLEDKWKLKGFPPKAYADWAIFVRNSFLKNMETKLEWAKRKEMNNTSDAIEFTELSELCLAVETALWVGHGGTTRNPAPFNRMIAEHDHIDSNTIIKEFTFWWSENSGNEILAAPDNFKSIKDGEYSKNGYPSEANKEYLKWVRHVCNSFKKNFVNQVARAEEREEKIQEKARNLAFKQSSTATLLDVIGDALSVHFEGNEKAKNALKTKAALCKNDETLAAFIKNALYSFSATMISEKKDSDFWASVDRFGMDFKDGGNPTATDGQIVSTIKKCFFVQSTKKKISPAGWASSVSVEEKTGFDFSPYSKIFASLSAALGVTIK